nr:MAG TPA: hypothetical protein [Caudoviricetes sp.]
MTRRLRLAGFFVCSGMLLLKSALLSVLLMPTKLL